VLSLSLYGGVVGVGVGVVIDVVVVVIVVVGFLLEIQDIIADYELR
jgi:hypothetical protein